MKRVAALCSRCALLCIIGTVAPPARAQPSAAPEDSPNSEVTLPKLRHFVEAEWPSGETPRADVAVLVEMTIDENGKVSDPSVVESAGDALDRAALAALRAFEFEPARRGDIAFSVRTRFRYVFPAPVVAAATEATENQLPSTPVELPAPSQVSEPIAVEPLSDDSYAAVASVRAPAREVTRRTIQEKDLTQIAGTSGDALRAIEVLPGVARTSITSGTPILRGSAWNESRSYIEGATVPLLYHLGGVKSAFNSQFLSRVDLYPGNYGSAYGNGTGGVISAKVRDPKTDRVHLLGEVSVLDSMALLEIPLSENAAVAVAGRRSNIDWFYDAVAPKSQFSVVALPVYYDYQSLGWFRLSPRHELRVMAYGSNDSLSLKFANPSDYDPALRDSIDYEIGYHRAQAAVDSNLGSRVQQHLQLTYGYTRMRQSYGESRARIREHELLSRGEWNVRASDSVRVNVGYDAAFSTLSGYYIGNRPPQAEGEVMNGGASTEAVVDLSDLERINRVRPAVYTELEWRPVSRLALLPSVRVDYYSNSRDYTIDPRLSCQYEVSPNLLAKWGLGQYSQNPEYYELIKGLGNPKLEPFHALQYSAGIEHQPFESLRWGVEGFYKYLYNRVVSTEGGTYPYFENHGTGKVYGAELFTSYREGNVTGWLAYTLARSTRQDRDEDERLFEADQTHILSVAANYDLGRGWLVGGRFRLTSGNPYTPVTAAVYDANTDVYQPINAAPFSARNPTFHQLDLRIEKSQTFGLVKMTAYLDIQNAYNAKNYEGFEYSYNYRERQRVSGLPIVPNLGLRGEL